MAVHPHALARGRHEAQRPNHEDETEEFDHLGTVSTVLFRRKARKEAEATISQVKMTERNSYGTATVRISYTVEPLDDSSFEAIRETKVKMSQLPQAGQRVNVSYDPDRHEKFEVLTPPGEETGTPTTPTDQIPWVDLPRTAGGDAGRDTGG